MKMNAKMSLSTCLALAAAMAVGGCKDDSSGLDSTQTASLDWSPRQFAFPKLAVNESADRPVVIENTGAGTLKLANFEASFTTDFELFYVLPGSDDQYMGSTEDDGRMANLLEGKVITIEPEEQVMLILNYAPQEDEAQPAGWVRFDTNSPANPTVEIPVVGDASGAEINVSPRSIDFGRVAAGDEKAETVVVTNLGQATLDFSRMHLNGEVNDFTISINGVDPRQDAALLADPDGDGAAGLSPTSAFELEVVYAPQIEGPDSGELIIETNDPIQPAVIVNLTANGASPCINVTPETLNFPAALVGRDSSRPVSIESCGGQPLEIRSIYLKDDSDEAYQLDEETVPDLPAALPAFDPQHPDQVPSRNVSVVFSPDDESAYGGTMVIESNDPVHGTIEVPIVGRGTINECPFADTGREEPLHVLPLDIITLDGRNSVDPDSEDGRPARYEWIVTQRPDGSTAEPVERFLNPARPADGGAADDTTTPTAFFFVDLAGEYTIELRVTDALDLSAPSEICDQPPATVEVNARPDEDIHVQLVWHTPRDRDETDAEGSDVDMHLLHPNGRSWAVAPLDCYYANTQPDWGPRGPAGNPSLDIDDTNGAGPENINLDQPEDTNALGGPYRVGIHYYRSENFLGNSDWGPSEVTVRIFLGGQQAGEWVRELQRRDHFWEVANIIWSAGDRRVQEVNRYHNEVPRVP